MKLHPFTDLVRYFGSLKLPWRDRKPPFTTDTTGLPIGQDVQLRGKHQGTRNNVGVQPFGLLDAVTVTVDIGAGDVELPTGTTPVIHATTHQSGGADAIKLDDLAAPDDNTDLDASTTKHGLLKKLSGTATEFMNGSGSWATPAGAVQDKIEEGNSKVEVIDTGTGYVSIYIDGAEKYRLGTSGIYDTSGNLLISFSASASAVNYLGVSNGATGNAVRLIATGSDANVGLTIQVKGSGEITLSASNATVAGTLTATGLIINGNTGHTGTYSWLDGDGMTTRNIDIDGGAITNAYDS